MIMIIILHIDNNDYIFNEKKTIIYHPKAMSREYYVGTQNFCCCWVFMYVERNVASDELPHVKLILPSENLYCP